MKADPIVSEVRKNRQQLVARCGADLKEFIEDAKSRQTSSGHHLVSFAHRRQGQSTGEAGAALK